LQPPTAQAPSATDVPQPASTLTQALLHSAKPLPHTNVQALATHAGRALATLVVQALPHIAQSFAVLVVSTHVPEHTVVALEGHVAAHAYVPPEPAQSGVLPVHLLPHAPQLAALEGSTHPSGHASMPSEQVGSVIAPSSPAPSTRGPVTCPASRHSPEHVPAE
jgi:hypothetical protein